MVCLPLVLVFGKKPLLERFMIANAICLAMSALNVLVFWLEFPEKLFRIRVVPAGLLMSYFVPWRRSRLVSFRDVQGAAVRTRKTFEMDSLIRRDALHLHFGGKGLVELEWSWRVYGLYDACLHRLAIRQAAEGDAPSRARAAE